MSIFRGYDGELRIYDRQSVTSSYYMKVLFCNMDFAGPISRGKTEETLILDRGQFDSNSHYIQGSEEVIYGPMSLSFSCRLADTTNSQALSRWISGVTKIPKAAGGTTTIKTWSGYTTMPGTGVSVPSFEDTGKMTYRVEVLWDGVSDVGYRYDNVFFRPGENTISESEEAVTLNVSGQVYGGVSPINAFMSGSGVSNFI